MVKIILQRIGDISEENRREIVAIIEECYERLKPHKIELLDLLLFQDSSKMKQFYLHEREAVGVVSEDFGEHFIAVHEAWRGISRISVCLESTRKVSQLIQRGALQHEVGHSVLHGSMEYYLFPFSAPLIEASKQFSLSKKYFVNLLYLVSIAVKDYEVTKLLVERGFVDDQTAYSNHMLKTSKEDLDTWAIAKGNPISIMLSLAARFKDAACFIALQSKLSETKIVDKLRKELSYLPDPILENMLKILKKFPQTMVNDTFQNVNTAITIFTKDLLPTIIN
jgi:hypothetical protein